MWTVLSGILVGTIFLQLPATYVGAFNAMAVLFYTLLFVEVPMISATIPLIEERAVFYREVRTSPYLRTRRKPL